MDINLMRYFWLFNLLLYLNTLFICNFDKKSLIVSEIWNTFLTHFLKHILKTFVSIPYGANFFTRRLWPVLVLCFCSFLTHVIFISLQNPSNWPICHNFHTWKININFLHVISFLCYQFFTCYTLFDRCYSFF